MSKIPFVSDEFEQRWSGEFEQVTEPEELWGNKPRTIYDKVRAYIKPVTDYLGLYPARPKTAPMITEQGGVDDPSKIVKPVDEAMNALTRGMDAAAFGVVDELKKAVTGEGIPIPETTWGTVLGAGAELAGFLKGGPFASAQYIVGGRLNPTKLGLQNTALAMAHGGATLGIASALSSIVPAIQESESLTEMGLTIAESGGISTLVGALFPVFAKIKNRPLRIALGMAVMDKIRTGLSEFTSFDDYASAIINGKEDKKWIAQRTFDYLMDLYFLSKVKSMKESLREAEKNAFVKELTKLNESEIEQTILALRESREIRRSSEGGANLLILNHRGKQTTWEGFREENGLKVALKNDTGEIFIGNKGEIHAELWARLPEGKYTDGFVLDEVPGRFFSREEMLGIYKQLESASEQTSNYASVAHKPTDISFTHWRRTGERVEDTLKPKEHMGLMHGEERKTVTNYGRESKGGLVVDRVYVYTVGTEKEGVIQASSNLYIGNVPRDRILNQRAMNAFRKIAERTVKEGKEYAPGDQTAIEEIAYRLARENGFIGFDTGSGIIKFWVDVPVKRVGEDFLGGIVESHDKTGGSTFNVMSGENLVGKDFFSVSVYTDREIKLSGREISTQTMKDYIAKNADLLSKPENSVGTWYDESVNKTYLDVVVTVPDKAEAIRLAQEHRQKAIYDLKNEAVIEVGRGRKVAGGYASVGKYNELFGEGLPSTIQLPELVGLAADIMNGKYPEIEKKLATAKKLGGSVAGLFIPREGGNIKLSPVLFKDINQVLYVLGHELGHAVGYLPDQTMKRGNILGWLKTLHRFGEENVAGIIGSNEEIRGELKALTQSLKPFDEEANPLFAAYRYSNAELYADAFTALVNNPKLLKDTAPKFYDAFFENLSNKPDVERLYYQIQDSIKSGTARSESVQRLRESFREGDRKESELLEKLSKGSESAGTTFVDKNWYSFKKFFGTDRFTKIRGLLEDWDYRVSKDEAYMRDISARVLRPIENAGLDKMDFYEWLFHKRVTEDRAEIANPGGWNPKDSGLRLAEMQETMPDAIKLFENAHNEFWKIRKEYWLDTAKELNIYNEELMKKLEDNDFYVTFRVQDYLTANYGPAVSAKIHQQVGTLKMIVNPFAQTLAKDISLMHSITKIRASRGLIQAFKELFPGEIKPAETRWNGKFQEIIEPTEKGWGLLVDLREGKAKGWYVPEGVVKSFDINPLESMYITKVLRSTIEPFRMVFTEINYGFYLFNAMRDYYRAARNLPGGNLVNFFSYWKEGLKPSFRSTFGIPDDVAQLALKREMLISVTDTKGMKSEDFQVEKMLVKYGIESPTQTSKFWSPVNNFITALTNVGRALERTPKLGAMKYLDEKFPDMPEEQKAHIVRSWAGSPNFLAKGTAFGVYNNLLIFSNAMKEGYRGDFEVMKSSPAEFWYKTTKYHVMPKLLMKAAGIGLLGAGIKEIFDRIPEYDLTNYNIIPIGLTPEGKAVFFRLPTDETGRFLGGIVWKMAGLLLGGLKEAGVEGLEDEKLRSPFAERGLFSYMAGQAPGGNPGFSLVQDIISYSSGQNPFDEFRGRYAIPDQVWKADDWRTDYAFAKYLANQLGISLIYRFKTEDDVEIKGIVEQLVNFPVVSNTLGRFLKVTDYGLREHIRQDVLGPVEKNRAREILDAHEAIAKLVNGKDLSDKDMAVIIREEAMGSQVVSRTVIQDIGRRYGTPYSEALLAATSIDQKIAILREIARKQKRGE